jgi:hypothetical protein
MSLLLSTESTDSEADRERRKQVKAASGILGATAFVGSASLQVEKDFQKAARNVFGKVLRGILPDILYLPTPNRQDVRSSSLFDLAMKLGADVPLVFCYDSGDSSEAFRPTVFVAVSSFLKGKEEAVAGFGFPSGHILGPKQLPARARQWAGRAGGRSVEPLEAVRGSEPWPGASATS